MTGLLDLALQAAANGLTVVPPRQDGTKAPDGRWREYETTPPTVEQLHAWYAAGERTGIGIVTGATSGNLEMLELEGRAVGLWRDFCQACETAGIGDVLDQVVDGYAETTPSGGVHLIYRCDQPVAGNQKLARRPAPDGSVEVLIETRGEGGYVVVAPSNGGVHPTGGRWEILRGGFDTITTLTAQQREQLLEVARSFDQLPAPEVARTAPIEPHRTTVGESWMDQVVTDFNAATTWTQILGAAGWQHHHRHGDIDYWTRPGKNPNDGHSATTNANGTDRLIVFSSSVAGFSTADGGGPSPSYDRFGAWTVLQHQGDRAQAAHRANEHGFGPQRTPRVTENDLADLIGPGVNNAQKPDDDIDPDLDEFLAQDDDDYDWLVPGLLERGDRTILTGPEGGGKSTLLRQLAIQLASGIHPFTLDPIDPLQVLLVDCENSPRQARRALRNLRTAAGDTYNSGKLRMRVLGHSIELAKADVMTDLGRRIVAQQVDVLIIGPLYKLLDDDPVKELPAKAVADSIDWLRNLRQSAVVIEAHSPYAEGHGKQRPVRPYGASLWSRWPEFGIHLDAEGKITHWRGQRDERAWPTTLQRATPWPWAPRYETSAEPASWDGPTECQNAVVALVTETGGQLSTSQITKRLRERGLSFRDATVATAARMAADNGRLDVRSGPRGALLYSPPIAGLGGLITDPDEGF